MIQYLLIDNVKYYITNLQAWGQRLFFEARSSYKTEHFITTKGFDLILIRSSVDNRIEAKFSGDKFNPYLCIKEEDLFKESQIVEDHLSKNKIFKIEGIGPSDYSGTYRTFKYTGQYIPNIYCESLKYELDFDLFKYQNDDLYYIANSSKHKDRLPLLVNKYDQRFDDISIIHGVDQDGIDYFDTLSLNRVMQGDMGIEYQNPKGRFESEIQLDFFNFKKYKDISVLEDDCGYIQLRKEEFAKRNFTKRKLCYRYLYEYFQIINKSIRGSRKKVATVTFGPRDFKKEEYKIIFPNRTAQHFRILALENINTLEKKCSINRFISGDIKFVINGYKDYLTSRIDFDGFSTNANILKSIKETYGVNISVKLGLLISQWLQPNQGYLPRQIKLPMARKANSQAFTGELMLYDIPIKDDYSDEYNFDKVYVNFFSLLANFGIHHNAIRSMLIMDIYKPSVFEDYFVHIEPMEVCRDFRRNIFKAENIPLSKMMIPLNVAIEMIELFATSGKEKNGLWYSNANLLLQAFPDATKDYGYWNEYAGRPLQNVLEDEKCS